MQLRYKLCALRIAIALVASSVNAEYQDNYYFNDMFWYAKSTSGIENIIQNGNEVTFKLISDICINDRDNDCGRDVLRNQLQQKHSDVKLNVPVKYSFEFKKENMHGTMLKIWELKPFGGNTNTVPTISINTTWINVKYSNDHDMSNTAHKDFTFIPNVWNNIIVETLQTTNDNGYVIIKLNNKIVFEYHGQTSYHHRFPLQYWIGPYICCGHPDDEPNHKIMYKNIS